MSGDMRLTLDWDSEELREMHMPAVRDRQPANENQRRVADFTDAGLEPGDQWELWTSSNHGNDGSGDGYHYIEYGVDAGLSESLSLRTAYGDDRMRISMDQNRINWGSPFLGVMYHMKNIKPGEHAPYETGNRAELVERHGFEGGEYVDTKNPDGTVDYQALVEALAEHSDFSSRAALFRRVQQRESVAVETRPAARGYDIAKGRRSPQPNEAKALRDYAQSREIGHYGDGAEGRPKELDELPSRTTFHEYFEMPEFEMGEGDIFDRDEDEPVEQTEESEWYPANVRTGTYGDVDEMTVKQIHDNIMGRVLDQLAPSSETKHADGTVTKHGFDEPIDRYDYAISLERDRPIEKREFAEYRRTWLQNQQGKTPEKVRDRLDRDGVDPWGEDTVHWELLVFEGENALEGGDPSLWWMARGVLDTTADRAISNPVDNSTIVCDTRGWL